MAQWIFGALMGILSLFGLLLASRAEDGMFSVFGWLLFVFGLVIIFVLIHRATDPERLQDPEQLQGDGDPAREGSSG